MGMFTIIIIKIKNIFFTVLYIRFWKFTDCALNKCYDCSPGGYFSVL
jgi:hypothetical protein